MIRLWVGSHADARQGRNGGMELAIQSPSASLLFGKIQCRRGGSAIHLIPAGWLLERIMKTIVIITIVIIIICRPPPLRRHSAARDRNPGLQSWWRLSGEAAPRQAKRFMNYGMAPNEKADDDFSVYFPGRHVRDANSIDTRQLTDDFSFSWPCFPADAPPPRRIRGLGAWWIFFYYLFFIEMCGCVTPRWAGECSLSLSL